MKKRLWVLVVMLVVCGAMRGQSGPAISGLLVNGAVANQGPVGAQLTIQGSGFGSSIGFSQVTLNGSLLASSGTKGVTWSSTTIVVASIPQNANSGALVVKVSGKTASVNFTVGPVITGVTPGTALAGSSVMISGAGFGTAGGMVQFNGVTATTSGWTDAGIQAQVPGAATTGAIVVTPVNGVASNGMGFTPTPAITSLSPSHGLSGGTLTITGNSFGLAQGNGGVTFNGVTAAVSAWNDTSITVTVPGGALTGPVVVTVSGVNGPVASAGVVFTYTPQITGLSPSPALADTPVTIQGNNFNVQQNSSTVTFNGVVAAVSSWSNAAITAVIPGTATPGPVVVTVNGVTSNGVAFSMPALYSFSLSYAPDGDVLSANDSVNGNWTYSYDGFNRLSTAVATNGTGCAESYDQFGNRWSQQPYGTGSSCYGSSVSFTGNGNGNNNRMDGFSYDAAGNVLNDGSHQYLYDAENRIIAVDGGSTASYTYDGDGHRIQKVTDAGTAVYFYDLNEHVIAEVNGAGVWTRGEVYAGGNHIATYGNGAGGPTYLTQVDWLGTERERLLPNGDTYEMCTSLPFGDGEVCQGASDPSPDHFTGKERDNETGLDDSGARHYASTMGRFMQSDPVFFQASMLADPQRFNLYAYVRNNPLILIDPKGESIELTGDEEQRKKQLQVAQSAVGSQAGKYLYQNKVETTDANGNKTTRYFIGVYTNGPDGKGPAFGKINNVSEALGNVISDSRVAQVNLAQSGTRVTDNLAVTTTIGPIPSGGNPSNTGPGATYIGQDGQWHVTLLDTSSSSPGQLPGNYMSNGQLGVVDDGILFGHEFGHIRYAWGGFWRHALDDSNSSAVRLENDVRKTRDPNAAMRNQH